MNHSMYQLQSWGMHVDPYQPPNAIKAVSFTEHQDALSSFPFQEIRRQNAATSITLSFLKEAAERAA